jgi:hypothetical protein
MSVNLNDQNLGQDCRAKMLNQRFSGLSSGERRRVILPITTVIGSGAMWLVYLIESEVQQTLLRLNWNMVGQIDKRR